MDNLKKINDILVNLFGIVLKLEEDAIRRSSRKDLSITELHTLVAVGIGKPKTMSQVAASLKINVSTLTTAVNKLVQKGYIQRLRTPEDRRIVNIRLTRDGAAAVEEHEAFHMAMVADAVEEIDSEDMDRFIKSLEDINEHLLTLRRPPARVEGPFRLKPVCLGKIRVPVPIVQGALSVGLSMGRLAAAVAAEGGVGTIAASKIGYGEPDFLTNPVEANTRVLKRELEHAFALVRDCGARGPIGVNVMWSAQNRETYIQTAVEAGAEVIVCGAGIPTTLPRYCKDHAVALVPIISSKRAADIIIRNWAKKYNRAPDGFIFQGPLAGGYLGVKESQIETAVENFYQTISDIKEELEGLSNCPLIVGGGIFSREDAEKAYAYGADGFQMGTRFVMTEECAAPDAFKEAYIKCEEKDITMVTSPEGFPGRVIQNGYADRVGEDPGCIARGLINAAKGDLDHGLIFCGSNAYKVCKTERVADIFKEFKG